MEEDKKTPPKKNNEGQPNQNEIANIPSELESALKDVPSEKRKIIMSQFTRISRYSGPIPPPEILERLNSIIPNGADRVLRMAENQSNHRIGIEAHAITEQFSQSKRGQNLGFALGGLIYVLAFILGIQDKTAVAIAFAGLNTATMVGLLIKGQKDQKKELKNKE